MVNEVVVDPTAFEPVIVYVVGTVKIVGVPAMSPVLVLKVKPAGNDGEIVYELILPPAFVGVGIPDTGVFNPNLNEVFAP